MPTISSSELIAQFQTALREGWGYIYGASGEIWTQAQQNAASREQTKKYGQKWVGHRVADCSGLFAWAFRQLGGYCYHGSNTMFRRYSSASGSLSAGKRTDGEPLKPGTAVYKFNASEGYHHVGLYIGEGKVIEAKGTAYTRLSHYLLSVHYLRKWLEQELISPADYRRMDKVLIKKYGFSGKSILRPECRRLLEK